MTNKQKQALLCYLGYYVGSIDGIWGSGSRDAAKRFRADYGLSASTSIDAAGEKMLIAAVAGTAKPVQKADEWAEIKYFRKEEFACKCGKYCNGYPAEIDMDMVRAADAVRERLGVPLRVNSGLRCQQWNRIQGGATNSRHLYGDACDLGKPDGYTVDQMYDIAEGIIGSTGGVGAYNWGIHIDKRGSKARWDER